MDYPQRNTNSKNATVSIALKILDRKFEENSSQGMLFVMQLTSKQMTW